VLGHGNVQTAVRTQDALFATNATKNQKINMSTIRKNLKIPSVAAVIAEIPTHGTLTDSVVIMGV